MSRLAAQANALYYPTELRVMAGIARLLKLEWPTENSGPIRIIDPAAGTGRAVATLIKILTQFTPQPAVEVYGIELDANRAEECQPYMTAVLNTDTKTAKVTDRSFDLLFCNPPYDLDTLGQDKRLEHAFLIRCTKMVRPGGYIVWIIPRYVLEVSADWLAAFYKDHIVRCFPKPESERFDQIVIVAQRKAAKLPNPKRAEELTAMSKGESEIKLLDCPNLEEFEGMLKELQAEGIAGPEIDQEIQRLFSYKGETEAAGVAPKSRVVINPGPKSKDKINFAYGEYHPGEAMLEAEKAGIWSNPTKRDLLFVPPSQAMVIKVPLMPMRIGMSSQFIQIGLGNNLLLRNEQRKIVIKGKTVKRWKNVAVELDDEGQQKKRIDREVISSEIKVLDLGSGEVETLDPDGLGKLLAKLVGDAAKVRIEEGKFVLTPLSAADLPNSVDGLKKHLNQRLPWVELISLLIEVDSWTKFSQAFEHPSGYAARSKEAQEHLYMAIVAQACNFSLARLEKAADFTAERLGYYSDWYLSEANLRGAITKLVNYQYHQPLAQHWGNGTLSSSDGQRFPVAVPNRKARALPRYFGYGKGLTFYTWTSDQHSQYGSKLTISTDRDALYILDEILNNETELPLLEHTADTAGFTDLIFGLFALLGLQFSPRIRDIGEQRLYRTGRLNEHPVLKPLIKQLVKRKLIVAHWDELLRLAASLKFGWVTASLLISKLQAFPQRNATARALAEYGRLVKTIFILRYYESEDYRHRIEAQLNKGEGLHALREFIFFANRGELRKRQLEAQAEQASCLNLVTNAVVVWNTIYMTEILAQLKQQGQAVDEADLAHISPTRYEHINPHGRYSFNLEEELGRTSLRELRPVT